MYHPDCQAWQLATARRTWSTAASAAGSVRVRPTGLVHSPTVKRYQYTVAGSSPVASTWTAWAWVASAVATPSATTSSPPSSVDTTHRTATSSAGMAPSAVVGSGTRRVHRITASGVGSPDATPRVKGSPGSAGTGRLVGASVAGAVPPGCEPGPPPAVGRAPSPPSPPSEQAAAPRAASPPATKIRRESRGLAASGPSSPTPAA